jgi:uncharacterized protein YjbI with pentapeptide repeats
VNREHVEKLVKNAPAWNQWRIDNPTIIPDLYKAILYGANLSGADLRNANLGGALLYVADVRGADLHGAYLCYADLRSANLTDANLCKADLRGADLRDANLYGANLSKTVLDPKAPMPTLNLYGLTVEGEYVIGYRTKRSRYCGNTTYEAGESYEAPWFSVDTRTDCHPGMYFYTSLKDARVEFPNDPLVKVKAPIGDTLRADAKIRTKRLFVMEDVTEGQ